MRVRQAKSRQTLQKIMSRRRKRIINSKLAAVVGMS